MSELIVAVLRSGTPLLYVTLAAMLAQRAGVWHLGLEGLMIAAACAVVIGTITMGSLVTGVALAVLVCLLGSLLLWYVIEKLKANAIIAGIGLSGFGLGATHFAVQAVFGTEGAVSSPIALPKLTFLPEPFSVLSVQVAAIPFIVIALWLVLKRSRLGLIVTASGEHPFAARSVGADPSIVRLGVLLVGGVLAAMGGIELALGSLEIFSINMTAGRGYMAFVAAIFGGAHPLGSSAAAFLFAFVETLGIRAQLAFGNWLSPSLILTLPYLATIFALWLSGYFHRGTAQAASAELKDA
jgi:ABC-type uncharacterized transport system permease subunit